MQFSITFINSLWFDSSRPGIPAVQEAEVGAIKMAPKLKVLAWQPEYHEGPTCWKGRFDSLTLSSDLYICAIVYTHTPPHPTYTYKINKCDFLRERKLRWKDQLSFEFESSLDNNLAGKDSILKS